MASPVTTVMTFGGSRRFRTDTYETSEKEDGK